MQPRRHRMRQQQRRESARGWISSGATVTIKTYARRYGVDRYTAHEDLTALGFPLPASAQHWAQRPPPTPRPGRKVTTDTSAPHTDWIMMDGRPFFVAGYTSGGFPYGIFEDEMHDHDRIWRTGRWPGSSGGRSPRTSLGGDRKPAHRPSRSQVCDGGDSGQAGVGTRHRVDSSKRSA